jgi:hypothetical protein
LAKPVGPNADAHGPTRWSWAKMRPFCAVSWQCGGVVESLRSRGCHLRSVGMLLAVSRCRPARSRRVPHHTAACPHGLRSTRDACYARGADDTGSLAGFGLVWSSRGTRTTRRRRGTLGRRQRGEQAVLVQASTSRWFQARPSSPGTTVGTGAPRHCIGRSARGTQSKRSVVGEKPAGGGPRWATKRTGAMGARGSRMRPR